MKLGVYICDRGISPTGIRILDSDEQDCYVIGRPTSSNQPDIAMHNGNISKRHAVVMAENPGYWSVTSLGRNGSQFYRDGKGRPMTKGTAIAIEDDDRIEIFGMHYAITFKTDLSETISNDDSEDTAVQSQKKESNSGWWDVLGSIYSTAGKLERFLILLVAALVAIAVVYLLK